MMDFDHALKAAGACSEPGGAGFYRNLWGMRINDPAKKIHGLEEWSVLPFVTKEALLGTPFTDRLFIEPAHVDHLRMSSGTSGKPPLFSARTPLQGMDYRLQYHDFRRPMLAYWVPAIPHWHESFQKAHGATPHVIVYDPKYPAASIKLANAVGADSISTFAFHISAIGEQMASIGMADSIRLIEICGEACSRMLYDYIRTTFPNATIIPFYGSSEVEDSPIGAPCRAITGEEPLSVYHAKNSQYHELIDPLNGEVLEPVAGTEGELVITSYTEALAFPLIRYRTGDIVRVIETQCVMHDSWSFTVLGRAELDFIKIPGGVLRADELERVLQSLKFTGQFELHRYEHLTASGPQTQVELRLEVTGDRDLVLLARDIAQLLRVAPEYTYANGVDAGRYLPLTCVPLADEQDAKKAKRLTDHLNEA
jgi:phenylacetate-coenzyme A ligase PaaK-like adenylate-forming protein